MRVKEIAHFKACRDCMYRYEGCRNDCDDWHSEHILYELRKQKIRKARRADNMTASLEVERTRRAKKKIR